MDPRHVEVQIVADAYGDAIHAYERDGSLQRRHQKIIEEAPAMDLPMELRNRLGDMAIQAAHAVGSILCLHYERTICYPGRTAKRRFKGVTILRNQSG